MNSGGDGDGKQMTQTRHIDDHCKCVNMWSTYGSFHPDL